MPLDRKCTGDKPVPLFHLVVSGRRGKPTTWVQPEREAVARREGTSVSREGR